MEHYMPVAEIGRSEMPSTQTSGSFDARTTIPLADDATTAMPSAAPAPMTNTWRRSRDTPEPEHPREPDDRQRSRDEDNLVLPRSRMAPTGTSMTSRPRPKIERRGADPRNERR